MNCPACDRFTPDDQSRCVNCGAPVAAPTVAEGAPRGPATAAPPPRRRWRLAIVAGGALLVALLLIFRGAGGDRAVNSHRPGEEIDLAGFIPAGKMTIVDFYSEYCPPCRQISPKLAKLGGKRRDLAILKFDINRKGVRGIDWGSPLARQYGIQSVPSFRIYDRRGELQAEGQPAFTLVVQLLVQERLW